MMVQNHSKGFRTGWAAHALDILYDTSTLHVKRQVKTKRKRTRLRKIKALEDVIYQTIAINSCDNDWLHHKLQLTKRTARHYTNMLCKLRWNVHNFSFYDPNPFLECLLYFFPQRTWRIVKKFASYQVDLMDLFTLPLQEAISDEISDVQINWSQIEPTFGAKYFGNLKFPSRRIYPYWNGIVQIKAEGKKKTHCAILPYNIHWTGRNSHITLPIPFRFYGIEKAAYSKGVLKIHFDNSIRTAIPLGSASWFTRKLLNNQGKKHWSNFINSFMSTYWKSEYSECFNFDTHEKVLRNRLINKTRPINEIGNKEFVLTRMLQV